MNQVATTRAAGAIASLQGLKQGLQNVQATLPARMTDPFLRFGKDGIWVYGQDNVEVEDGSHWAINPMSIRHGWSCWTNYPAGDKRKNEKLGEIMVGATQPKPDMPAPKGEWGWKDQMSFVLVCLDGEDKGTQVLYNTNSVGGMNAVNELLSSILAQLDRDPHKPVPVVLLEGDSYNHKSYGKTYTPQFKITNWVELTDDLPETLDEVDPPQPGGQTEVEDAKEAVQTVAAEQPQTSRRRASAPADDQTRAATPEEKAATQQAAGGDEPRRRRRAR